jgi:hypothetical protein
VHKILVKAAYDQSRNEGKPIPKEMAEFIVEDLWAAEYAFKRSSATLDVSIEYTKRLHDTIELAASIFKAHEACRNLCHCGYKGAVTQFFEQSESYSKFLEKKLGKDG